jgi:hypothetical protein
MMRLVLLVALALLPSQETSQERPPVPKDSIRLVLNGCLNGRVLAVSDVRQPDVQSGPDVRARSFRIAGKRDVMKVVKRENHHLVEVTGLVKRSALTEPGVKIGKRVVIGGGAPVAGSGSRPAPSEFIPVLDAESVQPRATSCGAG